MNEWGVVFLGINPLATLATAVAHVGLHVAVGLLVRRMTHLVERMENDLKPMFEHLNAIGRDASRAASLATAQVERLDRGLNELIQRVEGLLGAVQGMVSGRVGEAGAFFTALRAFFGAFRPGRQQRRARAEDEEAMFI